MGLGGLGCGGWLGVGTLGLSLLGQTAWDGDPVESIGPVLSESDRRMFRENTADESSGSLHIPEPLVFDLVRPLGAKRGEFEANTLLRWVASGEEARFQWAPEIEYAVWDGHAVELELPFLDTRSEALKLAYQMTLPTSVESRFVHGFQVVGERVWLGERGHVLQPVYIAGYATRGHASFLTITGVRMEWTGSRMETHALLNPSVFYNLNQQLAVGVETNWEFKSAGEFGLRVLPQLHMEVGRSTSFQMGVGVERAYNGDLSGTVALRVIRTF